VWDSPNSAGIVIDAVRCAKLGLDHGLKGALIAPSSYFKKSPPVQIPDDIARELVEEYIKSPKAVEARMRVAPPTLKREAPPTLKRDAAPAAKADADVSTNGRSATSAKRVKAGRNGDSANGHQPTRAAKKPRRGTSSAR